MILSDRDIRTHYSHVVTPFKERTVQNGLTFGLGAHGYDVRIAEGFLLMPGDFVLGSTIDRFQMPRDIMGRVCDKSTWARRGLAVQNTVLEAGWSGYLTLELTNHSKNPVSITSGDPIAQVLFEQLSSATTRPYSGKYQNAPPGPQEAIFER